MIDDADRPRVANIDDRLDHPLLVLSCSDRYGHVFVVVQQLLAERIDLARVYFRKARDWQAQQEIRPAHWFVKNMEFRVIKSAVFALL